MEAKGLPRVLGGHRTSKMDPDDWAQEKGTSGKPRDCKQSKDSKGLDQVADYKKSPLELQQEAEAEEEFEKCRNAPIVPVPCVGDNGIAREFVRGFQM